MCVARVRKQRRMRRKEGLLWAWDCVWRRGGRDADVEFVVVALVGGMVVDVRRAEKVCCTEERRMETMRAVSMVSL